MYKSILSYDGTRYFGWQKTSTGPSIQEEVEKALFRLSKTRSCPEAASRTDRGVHARGQVIQFALEKPMEPKRLQRALNALLPQDIRILETSQLEFHPTLDAKSKEYHYHLSLEPAQDPTRRLYSWHFPHPLDFEKIAIASRDLIGTHDFSSFCNEKEENPICSIESIEFDGTFRIKGNRFLYKMVRNLVGTLVYIGCGKLPPDSIPQILALRDRKRAGITAPAHGLCLHQVFYEVK